MEKNAINEALTRAVSAIDDAMGLVREFQLEQHLTRAPVSTLSSSLAEPQQYVIEMAFANVRGAVLSPADRAAFVSVIYACLAQGLINGATADRLAREYMGP